MEAEESLLARSPPSRLPEPSRMRRISQNAARFVDFRGRLVDKTQRQAFDLVVVILCYFATGTAVYFLAQNDFTLMYSFFYAVNVGLGVGYGHETIRDVPTKWYTVVHMLAGSSVIAGAFGVFFNVALARARHVPKIVFSGGVYFVAVLYGLFIAFHVERFDDLADAMVFVVSNYTSAGLIAPRDKFASLLTTTFSLFLGVPANALFMTQVAGKILSIYGGEPDDDAPVPADLVVVTAATTELDDSAAAGYQRYLEAQLLKTGTLTPCNLEEIRASFLGRPF